MLLCRCVCFVEMGNGQVARYIGGKRPQKYFQEDIWPTCEYTLKKLNIDEAR